MTAAANLPQAIPVNRSERRCTNRRAPSIKLMSTDTGGTIDFLSSCLPVGELPTDVVAAPCPIPAKLSGIEKLLADKIINLINRKGPIDGIDIAEALDADFLMAEQVCRKLVLLGELTGG